MQKFKRLLASIITLITIFAATPLAAHAEWRQGNNGWWYSQGGSSYATGWTQIYGKWYYFDSNGYMKTGWLNNNGNWYYLNDNGTMAHDCYVGDYYLNSNGAWTTSIPAQNASSNLGTKSYSGSTQYIDANGNGLIKGSKNHIYHVPSSTYYNKTTNVVQWFKTVEEAEAAGYRSPEK